MTGPIEAAARALYELDGYGPNDWDGETPGIRDRYLDRARVALDAAEAALTAAARAAPRAGLVSDLSPPF